MRARFLALNKTLLRIKSDGFYYNFVRLSIYLMFCMDSFDNPISSVSTEVSFLPIDLVGVVASRQHVILDRQKSRHNRNQTLT